MQLGMIGPGRKALVWSGDVLHVFVYAPWAERVKQVRARAESDQTIEEPIRVTDRERASSVQTHYACDWKDPHLYHMMPGSTLGREQAGWIIMEVVEQWRRHDDPR